MKSFITYYSYSGHTDKVVNIFLEVLRKKGEVRVERFKPKDEITSFFAQCMAAFLRKRAVLEENPTFNVSAYDLVLIGSPVWAFRPTPALNSFLDNVNGLNGKKVIVLLTSGSGTGVKRCFENIKSVLKNKGASEISEVNIPDRRLNDENFIIESLVKVL